ncbi:hydrogenase maturation nickel metallochaperone HypA [Campylobacter sp. faydin G-140]|uniref:hydrogenase maturation nickel metallochaperone HypA n=1 Tax=Campylobacter anatolicus TaxID=2829105 RepID=UPI001B96659D|nr:hydrogenase maturation nickel metallochaperone HypA [Campylobacter anatolicus]MBR8465844.1 hydrogenase maturation nickel metallochaperone HypA [Campylobacter anatolicus]
MHELSIAQSLLTLCEDNAKKQNASKISKIFIKIGRLSGVEAHYLQNAFDVCKAESICEESELIIEVQNIVIKCNECGKQNELNKNEFICPKCGSSDLVVIDGEDMMLMRLEMS